MRALSNQAQIGQFARYVVNGLVATAVHFSVLSFNMQVLQLSSAGASNGIAAIFGIAASFIGSRYFVFRGTSGSIAKQGVLFIALYAGIALLHALVLYAWTDRLGLDYRIGFILATGMQMVISFFANKFLVFK